MTAALTREMSILARWYYTSSRDGMRAKEPHVSVIDVAPVQA
ncbi:hypothetical protein [Candidatus Nitrososphaera gargensis]|nr:hypothetical protein [Candidatus Nitrososphaera gargensis]